MSYARAGKKYTCSISGILLQEAHEYPTTTTFAAHTLNAAGQTARGWAYTTACAKGAVVGAQRGLLGAAGGCMAGLLMVSKAEEMVSETFEMAQEGTSNYVASFANTEEKRRDYKHLTEGAIGAGVLFTGKGKKIKDGSYKFGSHTPYKAPEILKAFPDAIPAKKKTSIQGGGGLRERWKDKKYIYEWDSRHGRIEKYNKNGKHLGEFCPETGKQLKPADSLKKVEK